MAESETPEATKEQTQPFLRRGEDYESLYANSVYFQPSEWDMKLIFGELDTKDNTAFVEQHTAITLPWLQAKIMHYFLTLQLGVYEMNHRIEIPPNLMPPAPTPPTGESENDPVAQRTFQYIKKMREQFIASIK
jgi:hypothetical protein